MIIFIKLLQLIFRLIFLLPTKLALTIMYASAWLLQAIVKMTPLNKMARQNIKKVLPDSDAKKIARKLISNSAYAVFEILCLPFLKNKHLESLVKVNGLENITKALANGKGVIILTMHTGNYELCVLPLTKLGYKINGVVRSTQDPIFKIIDQSRQATGIKLINVLEKDMYQAALKLLEENEFVILLADTGALESRHDTRKFLGHDVPVATGWLTLAQRAGCAVLPCLAKKDGPKNELTICPPLIIKKENRQQAEDQIMKTFEDFIRANPEQWAMFWNSYETERMVQGR
ncbi:hypothetical protein A2291_04205 [candidate division WOR-1 bacterium RIFOXYB2_FULL_42_35]|uniref:Lipid A biosynthesis acyltransferase n=1 Tax=candidate division WOR-1 bacterium RIFOXYC2_FULL_41_25 TaxID=1802586 RepID=A0A1F4TMX4_UNCSA|nr:MAG: hypothetical protein A2247_01045 [candidate division WOR-1 bacterium RIFOXYA2_FULL_41_14]OGC24334.1 MAG: hypothetical protein A2291_04205 [candidate division WOR-1 bacterium RIFOXYB2_FULL_42_35]OGC34036.1 MAG: hypothetical protein A2462_01610 [candidate division WOR-1 bacterium RIFOXYC2_FULL_41_25]OGC42350.1 MAG: hypothetical protein A2548_07320 [candidate division WOR-1 bacterium RIFOXYD2_FULL_41_8]